MLTVTFRVAEMLCVIDSPKSCIIDRVCRISPFQSAGAVELCESRGGRPGHPTPHGLCGRKATMNLNSVSGPELWSCAKVEVDVLGSVSLPVLMVSVDVRRH